MSKIEVDTIEPQSGTTVTLGASGDTITVPSGATFNINGTGITSNGITMADQWRLTASTNNSTNADVTTNWERVGTDGWGGIGTGLTESSGIFSFPQTGIYLINSVARIGLAAADFSANFVLYTTLDNSTYDIAGYTTCGNADASNGMTCNGSNHQLFDVTDITTHKFKFVTNSFGTGTVLTGSTGDTRTGFTCIRLGDT